MHARDATGRQVSLLNDDPYSSHQSYHTAPHYQSAGDQSPPPHTPELLRSDSYDSNASYDAFSPLTPGLYDYTSRQLYDDYLPDPQVGMKRPVYVATSRSNSYEDDSSASSAAPRRLGSAIPAGTATATAARRLSQLRVMLLVTPKSTLPRKPFNAHILDATRSSLAQTT